MDEFKTYHPLVNMVYFISVIGFSAFLLHPVCLAVSLVCSLFYSLRQSRGTDGKRAAYIVLLIIAASLVNPAFNHEGVTILCYLPSGNPLTLESVMYGFAASAVLVSIICWFSCLISVMTSDKHIHLIGRVLPSISLIIAMTLRFVPRFSRQMKAVTASCKTAWHSDKNNGAGQRLRQGTGILSIMITWALESSVEISDSMRARGYGLGGRTSFSVFKWSARDTAAISAITVGSAYIIYAYITGAIAFSYFPQIYEFAVSARSAAAFSVYFALCALPAAAELLETIRWKRIKLKI